MEKKPFQDFIDTAPKRYIISKGYNDVPSIEYRYENDIETTLKSLNIETELHLLESYLFQLDGSDRFLYTKLILQDLINTYFDIRQRMSPTENENKKLQRYLMLEVYNAITSIITLLHRMDITISKEFIADNERRDRTGIIIAILKMFEVQNNDTSSISINTNESNINQISKLFTDQQNNLLLSKLKQIPDLEESANGYKWNGEKVLLAYIVEKINDHFNLRKGQINGIKKIQWKPFETLFNVSKLSRSKNDYMKINTNFTPSGYDSIDKLF